MKHPGITAGALGINNNELIFYVLLNRYVGTTTRVNPSHAKVGMRDMIRAVACSFHHQKSI